MQELFSWHPTYTGATLLLACLISNLLLSLKNQSFLHKACLMVPETKIWVLVECGQLTTLNLGVMVNSVSLLSASASVVDNCPTLSTFYYYLTSPEVGYSCGSRWLPLWKSKEPYAPCYLNRITWLSLSQLHAFPWECKCGASKYHRHW